jgi:hypothetical protein
MKVRKAKIKVAKMIHDHSKGDLEDQIMFNSLELDTISKRYFHRLYRIVSLQVQNKCVSWKF